MNEFQEQHLKVRRCCGVHAFANFSILDVTGTDRKKLLHGLLANEIDALKPGEGNFAHLLNPKGKVQAATDVYNLEDRLRLVCETKDFETLKKNIVMRILRSDVKAQDRTADFALFGVHGPKAARVLNALHCDVLSLNKEYQHLNTVLADQSIFVARQHYTGEIGFDLIVPKEGAQAVWQALIAAPDVSVFGDEACITLCTEAGVPFFGEDYNTENLSLEVNLNKAVSNSKGCYLGQEPVARLLSRGHVAKRLVGLVLDGKTPVEKDTEVWSDKVVGHVTRSIFAPTVGKVVANAFLKHDFLEAHPNARVRLLSPTGELLTEAMVVELPYYHNGEINFLEGGPQPERVIAPQPRTRTSS